MADAFTTEQVYYIDELTSRLKFIKGWSYIKPSAKGFHVNRKMMFMGAVFYGSQWFMTISQLAKKHDEPTLFFREY